MLTQRQIVKLATSHQTTEINILREYFQHLFLSYFYQQKDSEKIYFKGGTALRIIYNSPRFSEDLDFSTSLTSAVLLEKLILATLVEIQREGITVELAEAKKTRGGYLAIITLKNTEIQLQISMRIKKKEGEVIAVASDFLPPYTIISLKQELLVQEKIKALLNRRKPRDFYDLYFLLRAGLLKAEQQIFLPEVNKLLKKEKLDFNTELRIFLPRSHWSIVADFKDVLIRQMQRVGY